MKHTPGKWQTSELGHKDSGHWLIQNESGQLMIAETCGMASDGEDKANAELIARAPELLEENESFKKDLKLVNDSWQLDIKEIHGLRFDLQKCAVDANELESKLDYAKQAFKDAETNYNKAKEL